MPTSGDPPRGERSAAGARPATGGRSPSEEQSASGERTAALARLGQASAELIHDLAGVLSVLTTRIALARQEAERGRIPTAELEEIQREADELRAMLREVLDDLRAPSRSRDRAFAPVVELERAIDRIYRGGSRVPVRLRVEAAEDLRLAGPRTYFVRIVSNLVRNAARHARHQVLVTLRDTGAGTVELWVEDDGAGLPPERWQALLVPLSGEDPQGHGLGLSFSSWAAERLGGQLAPPATSPGLGGALLRLHLPLAPRTPPRATGPLVAPAPFGAAPPGTARPGGAGIPDGPILVVDDDAAVARAMARRLVRAGLPARALVAGEDTPEAELCSAISAQAPALVLLDLNLGSLDGAQVARELQEGAGEDAPGPVLILMTGGDTQDPRTGGFRTLHKLDAWDRILEEIGRGLEAAAPRR